MEVSDFFANKMKKHLPTTFHSFCLKLVFVLVILYIHEYLCIFTKLFTGTRVSEDITFRVSDSRNNRKRTALEQGEHYEKKEHYKKKRKHCQKYLKYNDKITCMAILKFEPLLLFTN